MTDYDDNILLQDISDQSGVEIRTLRSWLAQDLLLPPLRQGRGAGYPRANLTRALAIRAMREIEGASLGDIRRRLWSMSNAEVEETAALLGKRDDPIDLDSAADYLRGLTVKGTAPASAQRATPILDRLRADKFAAPVRKSRTRVVTVVQITPDIDLHVSGDLSPVERSDFERIAELIRAILKRERPNAE